MFREWELIDFTLEFDAECAPGSALMAADAHETIWVKRNLAWKSCPRVGDVVIIRPPRAMCGHQFWMIRGGEPDAA